MRYGLILGIVVGLFGCGEVMEATTPDAGAAGMAGTGGSTGGAGSGSGGSLAGAAGAGAAAGAGGAPVCVENTRADCQSNGQALVSAQYGCDDSGYDAKAALWGTCGPDGKISDDYYHGLPCPFDVSVVNSVGWTGPAPDAVDGVIITNGGGSTSAVWRSTPDTIYCCDNSMTVRKVARCR